MRGRFFSQVPGLDTRLVDGEAFIITPVTIRHLNPVASLIWQALEEPARAREVTEILAALYPEVPRATLAADVKRTLADLLREGLAECSHVTC